jgi:hypothetical protein
MTDPRDPLVEWLTPQDVELLAPAPGTFERISRSARRRRWRGGLTAGALTVLVGGVSLFASQQFLTAAARDPDAPPPLATVSSAPATAADSATAPSAPPSTAGRSPSAHTSITPRCAAGDLKVGAQGDPAGGGTQTTRIFLVFTNVATHTCILSGYPRVFFVTSADGPPVNGQFDESGMPHGPVTLPPNGTAHATTRIVSPDAIESCQPVEAAGFRVYPPDMAAAVFVASRQRACSAPGIGVPSLDPVIAGSGA